MAYWTSKDTQEATNSSFELLHAVATTFGNIPRYTVSGVIECLPNGIAIEHVICIASLPANVPLYRRAARKTRLIALSRRA